MSTAIEVARAETQERTTSILSKLTTFPALIAALLITKVIWTLKDRIAEPDLWWHLDNARFLVNNWRLPNVDTHCFTTVGTQWMNHEWLSELIYYAGFRAFGLFGIYLVCVLAFSALVAAVFSLCMQQTRDPLAAGLTTAIGGVLGMVGFGPRTQIFGWLCFVVMFSILLKFRSTRKAPLWLLPFVFCLWINCHGSWLIGLAVFAIFVVGGLIKRDLGQLAADPWSPEELRKLVITGVLSVAALLINPYGYRLLLFPFELIFKVPLMAAHVQEFSSVNFHDGRGKWVVAVLGALFLAAFLGKKKWRIDDAVLTAFVIYSSLTHVRFLLMAGIVLPPILAPQLGRISAYDSQRERRVLNSILMVVVLGVLVYGLPRNETLQKSNEAYFPIGAMNYLEKHPQQGRMFNLDAWGGYLQWNAPTTQTFIDTRVDIFQYKGVLKDYIDVISVNNSLQILDRYQVSYVIYQPNTALSYLLSNVPQWELIYSDKTAVVYRRVRL